jgi:hypothetical protein
MEGTTLKSRHVGWDVCFFAIIPKSFDKLEEARILLFSMKRRRYICSRKWLQKL